MGQRANLFSLPDIPVTVLSGKEFGVFDARKDLQRMADALLRELQKAPVGTLHNQDTGWDFVISKLDRRKMGVNPDLSHADSHAIAGILNLIANAVLAETHGDKEHNNTDVQAIHRLYAPVVILDVLYRVKLTIKDYKFLDGSGERKNLHALETIEIEKERALLGTVPPNVIKHQTAQPTTRRTLSISDLLKNATRDSDGKPFEQSGEV